MFDLQKDAKKKRKLFKMSIKSLASTFCRRRTVCSLRFEQ